MLADETEILRGFATKVSPLVPELFAADSRPVPETLAASGNYLPAPGRIPLSRYYDPAFAELEKERLWKKVWQFACREEDIPEVGDRIPYSVGTLSYMIVRSGPNEFRAFRNACLHRGTQLCDGLSSGTSVRCPFHAWEWNLDGSLRNIPSRWDFPGVKDEQFALPQAKVGTWGGFIFINPDPAAEPLEQALGALPEHFKNSPHEDRFTIVHVRKLVRANWKVTMEAFLESYHVIETHSDALGFTGDASTKYDIWDEGHSHFSRLITPSAVPSPHLGDEASLSEAANITFQAFAMIMPGMPVPVYDPALGTSGRAQVAEWRRQTVGPAFGADFSAVPDALMIDSIQYYLFPNFFPWIGEGLPLVYQFLPYGSNPDESVMSIRFTAPVPKGAPRPPSAPIREIGFDEPLSKVPEMGLVSIIFDQDMSNLPRIQKGIKSAAPDAVATFGRYQEQRIQHFHEVLLKTLGI